MKSPDATTAAMIAATIQACTASHRRLESHLVGLADDQARRPTSLPGWTVGHLLTHLARNADGHVRMLEGADRGDVVLQYVGGVEGRAADIDAGADRPAAALLDDLVESNARLERTWVTTTGSGWAGSGRSLGGELPTAFIPSRRLFECEVHHVDLGDIAGQAYTFVEMPADFVGMETRRLTALWSSRRPMGLTALPAAVLQLSPADRLAWLVGRLDVEGLAPAGVFG